MVFTLASVTSIPRKDDARLFADSAAVSLARSLAFASSTSIILDLALDVRHIVDASAFAMLQDLSEELQALSKTRTFRPCFSPSPWAQTQAPAQLQVSFLPPNRSPSFLLFSVPAGEFTSPSVPSVSRSVDSGPGRRLLPYSFPSMDFLPSKSTRDRCSFFPFQSRPGATRHLILY